MFEKLLDLQKNPPQLLKDASNPHFGNEYISLGALLDAVVPALNERGILLMQPLTTVGEQPAITTKLVDTESGEILEYDVPLVLDKQTPQAVGSAITYFRRYGLLTVFGFNADSDDDAEEATSRDSRSTSGKRGQKNASVKF